MLRILFFLAVGAILLGQIQRWLKRKRPATDKTLVPCKNCQLFVQPQVAICKRKQGKTIYFCSKECLEQSA